MRMKPLSLLAGLLAAGLVAAGWTPAWAVEPQAHLQEMHQYYQQQFPGIPLEKLANGHYALDPELRAEWEMMKEFPPWEPGVEVGEQLFHERMPDGKTMAACFPDYRQGIRQRYPYFEPETGEIVTLEGAINDCRTGHGAEPFRWKKGNIAAVSAYLAYLSRGKRINVEIPDDPRAKALWNQGRKHFWAKRGQLNFACADCHYRMAGMKIRANLLSTAVGQVTHFPVYRKKWEARGAPGPLAGFGTLHRRYSGCNRRVRAADFPAQGEEYKALEYYHTFLSNGLLINAPQQRF